MSGRPDMVTSVDLWEYNAVEELNSASCEGAVKGVIFQRPIVGSCKVLGRLKNGIFFFSSIYIYSSNSHRDMKYKS